MDNYMVIYKNLPEKVNAFTMYHAGDDYYTIVLNARQSFETLQKAFKHEMFHIQNKDFHSLESVDVIEKRAHAMCH